MKKLLFRISIALITFTVSLNFTWAIFIILDEKRNCENFCVLHRITSFFSVKRQGKLEVNLKDFVERKDGVYAEIEILNNSPNSAYFTTYNGIENELNFSLINGVENEPIGLCGTGLSSSHLHSGDKVTLYYPLVKLYDRSTQLNGKYKIGYFYGFRNKGESGTFWTNEFELPNWVKDKVKMEIKSYQK